MRPLVTGATGFIGFELAHQLSDAKLGPRLLVRRPGRAPLLNGLEAELMQGDLLSEPSLRRAVEGVDTVFHLAARATFENYGRLRPTIVDGSLALMRASVRAGVKHFVYASSMFVHASQASPIDELTAPDPQLDYGRAKWETEQALAEMAADAGMKFAVVRLPHTYGAQSLLFELIRGGLVIFPGDLRVTCGQLHVADAARALIGIARQGWTGTSPIADEGNSSWGEFFDVARAFYPRFRLVRFPRPVAMLGTAMLQPLLRLRTAPTLTTPGTITGFNLNLPVDASDLWASLGLRPQHRTIADGIPAALDDYIRFRWRHPVRDTVS